MTRSACGLRAKIRPLFWSPRAMVVTALALRLLGWIATAVMALAAFAMWGSWLA